ncbi:MAG: hypothetical protein KF770_31035 [Anaerolineae bacterium]|nr:hypothetical protein [Anaerolineae bacterium]
MTIIIYGKTVCSICGKVIRPDQKAIGLPHLISNELDNLFIYNDGAYHHLCFEKVPENEILFSYLRDYEELTERLNAAISTGLINNPEEILSTGVLSSDPKNPLWAYNLKFYSKNTVQEKELLTLKKLLSEEKLKGTIRGRAIDWITERIDRFISV